MSGPTHRGGANSAWALDPSIAFLNHGSFGACPREVLGAQRRWRDRMEAEPVRFLDRELEGLFAEARAALGAFVGASPDDIAFVPNATSGVNTVLRSIALRPGDELLTTDHAYNATLNAMRFVAAAAGARVTLARVPFPIRHEREALDAILEAVTTRTRLAVLDHVTSPTALVLPIGELVAELARRGVDVLVDGAHGPGMLPLDLDALGAAWYTGNCHKWLCAPKGSAFLHVRRDRQGGTRPLAISHGANAERTDVSRFRAEFDWTGTLDPTAWLSVPDAIRSIGRLSPDGWPGVMAANHALAVAARDVLLRALGGSPDADVPCLPAPDAMLGSMAAIPLPVQPVPAHDAQVRASALAARLRDRGFEVPLMPWPSPWLVASGDLPDEARIGLLVRVSAQRYNSLAQYEALGEALREVLPATM